MTVLTTGVVGACAFTASAAAPAVVGLAAGLVESVVAGCVGAGASSAVTGAAAAGAVSGTIAGAVGSAGISGVMRAVGTDAIVGSMSAVAITSAGTGTAGLATTGLASGPIGWIALGCHSETAAVTFDCWKPVLHDESREPSESGVLLKDVFVDHRIKGVMVVNEKGEFGLPLIVLENIWQEKFRIDYLLLPSNDLAAHAVRL